LFRNILIPTDGSDLAAKAVEQGVLFAKEIGAKITAVTVIERPCCTDRSFGGEEWTV
jgi:nucleotide-binding universal stress UspA family protein